MALTPITLYIDSSRKMPFFAGYEQLGTEGIWNVAFKTILDPASEKAEQLIEHLNLLFLKEKSLKERISMVVVNTGPGIFTGLRVSIAMAKGIAMGLKIPLYGLTHFQAMILALNPEQNTSQKPDIPILAVNAKGGSFYIQQSNSLIMSDENMPYECSFEELCALARDKKTSTIYSNDPELVKFCRETHQDDLEISLLDTDFLSLHNSFKRVGGKGIFIPKPLYIREADAAKQHPLLSFM